MTTQTTTSSFPPPGALTTRPCSSPAATAASAWPPRCNSPPKAPASSSPAATPPRLDQAKAQLGAGAIALRNDAGESGAAKALAARCATQGITLDAVFINAGVAKFAPLEGVDEALWDQTFNVNVKGAFFAIQALSPLLNTGAAVILNGSINAHIGMPNSSVYAASKAALISLAKTLSAELVARGIRVNVVSPGPVTTPLYGKLGVPADQLDALAAGIQAQVPAQALRHARRSGQRRGLPVVAGRRFHRGHQL
jgi:NAD(P)-dependent dehydrogenase (short-subunit alcohol dehydrogenase family)